VVGTVFISTSHFAEESFKIGQWLPCKIALPGIQVTYKFAKFHLIIWRRRGRIDR